MVLRRTHTEFVPGERIAGRSVTNYGNKSESSELESTKIKYRYKYLIFSKMIYQ